MLVLRVMIVMVKVERMKMLDWHDVKATRLDVTHSVPTEPLSSSSQRFCELRLCRIPLGHVVQNVLRVSELVFERPLIEMRVVCL